MDTIEKRARELLAAQYVNEGRMLSAKETMDGHDLQAHAEYLVLRAIIAALTPPEGYVLVQESQLRHLLNDAITSVEFIAGRGQSKPLSRRVRDQAWALVKLIPARMRMP